MILNSDVDDEAASGGSGGGGANGVGDG